MREFLLNTSAIIRTGTTSKGTQRKCFYDDKWFKVDTRGYEGLAESLASMVLSCSDVYDYVEYTRCKINGKLGCFSSSFLHEDEEFMSIKRLYKAHTGIADLNTSILYRTVPDRIMFVVDFIESVTGLNLRAYLGVVATIDMLLLNEDRHFGNLGVIYSNRENKYKFAPVFDNGLSLLSDYNDYPPLDEMEQCIDRVPALPFSGSFEEQVRQLGINLTVDYDKLFDLLSKCETSRAKNVLLFQLERYKNEINGKINKMNIL